MYATMLTKRQRPGTWKTIVLWLFVLAALGLTQYVAAAQRGLMYWEGLPWRTLTLFAAVAISMRSLGAWLLSRPAPPEVAQALERLAEERARCRRCGSARQEDDIFCTVCHPTWRRAICVAVLIAVATLIGLLVWLPRWPPRSADQPPGAGRPSNKALKLTGHC